jgi:CRP-like cAMP-binding protein
LLKHLTNNRLD